MKLVTDYLRDLWQGTTAGWNRFWFAPTNPATLSLIRLLAGAMLFYTHLVWTEGLHDFFSLDGWLDGKAVGGFYGSGSYAWSYFWLLKSDTARWIAHAIALTVFAMLTVGLFSRVVSVLAFLITVSYVNRVPGAQFGLDQINALLAMYLMVGPCGARYSVDSWLKARHAQGVAASVPDSIWANVAIRLIQLHMCVIYLFAGCSKLAGPAWWDGTALWGAFGNLEYQSLNMLWLVHWPVLINLMSLITVAWELSYAALVWPRLTRPIMIVLAVPLHLGIAICMGMITFGLAMLIGNLAFVSPALVDSFISGRKDTPRENPAEIKETREKMTPKRRARDSRKGAAMAAVKQPAAPRA